VFPLQKKPIKSGKRSRILERESAEFQEIPSVNERPGRFKYFDHVITLAAFRYALGRKTYVVEEIIEWLTQYWDEIPAATKGRIIPETEQAVMLCACGDECDQKSWESFLEFAHKKSRFL
jgi:hypothetical protein